MTGKLRWLPIVFCLFCVFANAQDIKLEPGKPIEREIAGGESHIYQIELQEGQFARLHLWQRALDVVLLLSGPDGKQLAERNLTGPNRLGEQESLSLEAPVTG